VVGGVEDVVLVVVVVGQVVVVVVVVLGKNQLFVDLWIKGFSKLLYNWKLLITFLK
jgi:hypothetical protein